MKAHWDTPYSQVQHFYLSAETRRTSAAKCRICFTSTVNGRHKQKWNLFDSFFQSMDPFVSALWRCKGLGWNVCERLERFVYLQTDFSVFHHNVFRLQTFYGRWLFLLLLFFFLFCCFLLYLCHYSVVKCKPLKKTNTKRLQVRKKKKADRKSVV